MGVWQPSSYFYTNNCFGKYRWANDRCIFYDGLVWRTEADEYVQITNERGVPVDLEG